MTQSRTDLGITAWASARKIILTQTPAIDKKVLGALQYRIEHFPALISETFWKKPVTLPRLNFLKLKAAGFTMDDKVMRQKFSSALGSNAENLFVAYEGIVTSIQQSGITRQKGVDDMVKMNSITEEVLLKKLFLIDDDNLIKKCLEGSITLAHFYEGNAQKIL